MSEDRKAAIIRHYREFRNENKENKKAQPKLYKSAVTSQT